MKIRALGVLSVLNLALLFGLALMWVQPDGTPRDVRWQEPAPLPADLSSLVTPLMPDKAVDASRFLAMLERPLFSLTRRPPPPPPPEQPPPPPDHLSGARLTGIVTGNGVGYAIVLINGKQRRVQQNQSVEGWTLKSFADRQVIFVRGDQSQALTMQRADVSKFSGVAPPPPTPSAIPRQDDGRNTVNRNTDTGSAAVPAPAPAPRPAPPRFGP
ncbi:MAG: hypothetical protein KKB95_20895 [Gammaproteobacteria bacterium]|nr:hypothetical protein [Gammaproteobacteria bacterium]MBU1507007.1 hypothetical protein [Gammaproteobacteria bacterium]MBU1818662.1 hypothetical protein [Gammaproteobacteria bacterium]MBU2121791.1 hypothetical protein [Gammaproteobacteria bacterium]MBU2172810.1 hypothetical protein [Gammaproteobacteria bacterium]